MDGHFVGGELSQYNKLYSIGVLPKVKGRYLSSQKINDRIKEKLRGRDRQKDEVIPMNRRIDYQMAKDKLNFEMKKAKDSHFERSRNEGLFPHLGCKTEQSEDANPERRVHTVEINKLFCLDNSPVRRQIFTLGIHKKILPFCPDNINHPQQPKPHRSLLRIIVKKANKHLIEPSHRSLDRQNKPLKIRINEQPFQFSSSSSDKVDILQREIDLCEIRLGKPLTLRKEKVRQTEIKKQPNSMRIHNTSETKQSQSLQIPKQKKEQPKRIQIKQLPQELQANSKSYESICRDLDNHMEEVSWSRAIKLQDQQWRWK